MENRVGVRLIAATLVLGLLPAPGVLAIEARIEGLDGNVADNVRHYLEGLDETQYSRTRLEGESRRRTAEAMRVYGYYEPQIEVRLAEGEAPGYVEIAIEPGPRVRIETLDFRLEGDAREDPPFQEAIDAFPLAVGRAPGSCALRQPARETGQPGPGAWLLRVALRRPSHGSATL